MLIDQNRIELKVYNSGYDECILRAGKTQAGRPADILAGSLVCFKDNVHHKKGEATHPGQVYYPSEGFCTPLYDQLILTRTVPVPASEGGGEQVDGHDDAYYRYRYEVEDHDTLQFEEDKQATYDITSFQPAIILENALQGLGINHKNHNGELVLCRELLAGDVYLMRAVKGRYLPTDRMYAVQTEDGIWVTNEASLPSGATLGMFIGYCQEVYEVTDEMLDVDEHPIVDRSNREWSDQSMNGRFVNLVKVRVAKTRMTTPRVPTIDGVSLGGYNGIYDGQSHGFTWDGTGLEASDTVTATLDGVSIDRSALDSLASYKDVGEHILVVGVEREGYQPLNLSATIAITRRPLDIDVTNASAVESSEPTAIGGYSISGYQLVGSGNEGVVGSDDVSANPVRLVPGAAEYTGNNVNVEFELDGSAVDNYYLVETIKEIGIYAYPIVPGITFDNASVSYDGSAHSLEVSGALEDDVVVYRYNGQTEFELVNAGIYEITATVSREGYTDWTDSKKLTILKINQTIDVSGYSHEYDGLSHSFTLSGNGGRAVSYRKGNSGNFVSGLPSVKNVSDSGTYYIKVAGDQNYNEWNGSVEVDITPADINVSMTPPSLSRPYNGNGSPILFGGLEAGDVVSLKVNGTLVSETVQSPSKTVTLSADAGTYAVTDITVQRSANYNVKTFSDFTVEITPKQLTVTGTTVADKSYDGTADAEITVGTVSGVISSDNVQVGCDGAFSSANVGTYGILVTYSLSGADAGNYNAPVGETISGVKILPINITGITVEGFNDVYDGSAHGVTVTGTETGDIVTYSDDGTNYRSAPYTYTSEGTDTTVYVKVQRANHNDWTGSAQIVIMSSGVGYVVSANGGDNANGCQQNTTEIYIDFDEVQSGLTAGDITLSGGFHQCPSNLLGETTLFTGPVPVGNKQRYTLQVAMLNDSPCKISINKAGIKPDGVTVSDCHYYPFMYGITYKQPVLGSDIDALQYSRFGRTSDMPSEPIEMEFNINCADWYAADPENNDPDFCGDDACGWAFIVYRWTPSATALEQNGMNAKESFDVISAANAITIGRVIYAVGFVAKSNTCSSYDRSEYVLSFME